MGLVLLNYDTLVTLDGEVRLTFSSVVRRRPPYGLFDRGPFPHQSLPIHCHQKDSPEITGPHTPL